MSDETKRPTSILDARMAKVLGVPASSVMVVELKGDDGFWRKTPLAALVGLARSVYALGLKEPGDWDTRLEEGDPAFEMGEACVALAKALENLRATERRYGERFGPGEPSIKRLAASTADQLEALMRSLHRQAGIAYKLGKAEREIEATREFNRTRPMP
jgi:uncharacterized membrane protein YccC